MNPVVVVVVGEGWQTTIHVNRMIFGNEGAVARRLRALGQNCRVRGKTVVVWAS